MRRLHTVLLVLATITGVATADTFNRELPARPGGLIEFDLDAGGTINMTGWSKDSISVSAEVTGRDADIVEVSVENLGGRVLVRSKFVERRKHKEVYIEIDVRVPAVFDVKVDSDGGGVNIDGVEGTFSGETQGGRIHLTNVRAAVDLKTRGGSISLTGSELEGSVGTLGGSAVVEDVSGNVEVTSAGGQVLRRRVTRSDGASIGDQIEIRSTGGAIDVPEAPHGADLQTAGGDIHVASAKGFVSAQTGGGDVRFDEVDGWVQATTNAGDVHVKVVGNHDVRLTSLQGEVRLSLPDLVDPHIEVQLEYTRNSSRDFRIESDFPIEIHELDRWSYDGGTPRKVILANAPGSGKHVVIRAVNGNVTLTR